MITNCLGLLRCALADGGEQAVACPVSRVRLSAEFNRTGESLPCYKVTINF